jgi:hypothetical protein
LTLKHWTAIGVNYIFDQNASSSERKIWEAKNDEIHWGKNGFMTFGLPDRLSLPAFAMV